MSKSATISFLWILLSTTLCLSQTVTTIADGFSASGGVRVDNAGNIFVADFGPGFNTPGSNLYKITASGEVNLFSSGLRSATGGNFDSNSNLFWSSFGANRVDRIDSTGQATFFASVNGPVAIGVDSLDNLFVASCNNNSVIRITPGGSTSVFATSNLFNCANGLTFDDSGTIYVSNFNDGRVNKVNSDGTVSPFATIPGNNAVNLAYSNNFIYVTSRAIHSIYRVSILGNTPPELFAGRPNIRGRNDGEALQATFSFPNGIAANADGTKLYTNDVATLAGSSFHPSVLREIDLGTPTSVKEDMVVPRNLDLKQNYPNPFNPTTTIRYRIATEGLVQLTIFNLRGEEIRSLLNQVQKAGEYSIGWDGKDNSGRPVVSGVYVYQLRAGLISQSRKMILIK